MARGDLDHVFMDSDLVVNSQKKLAAWVSEHKVDLLAHTTEVEFKSLPHLKDMVYDSRSYVTPGWALHRICTILGIEITVETHSDAFHIALAQLGSPRGNNFCFYTLADDLYTMRKDIFFGKVLYINTPFGNKMDYPSWLQTQVEWAKWTKELLTESRKVQQETKALFIMPTYISVADMQTAFSLTRSPSASILREFVSKVFVLPALHFLQGDFSGEHPSLREQLLPHRAPILVLYLNSKFKYAPVSPLVIHDPQTLEEEAFEAPTTTSVHLRLDCLRTVANGETSLFKVVNGANQDDSLTEFVGSGQCLLDRLNQPAAVRGPETFFLADWHMGPSKFEKFLTLETFLLSTGVSWTKVDTNLMYIASHQPYKKDWKKGEERPKKMESFDTRLTIQLSRASASVAKAVLWNKWDVLVILLPGHMPEMVAQLLKDADNISLTNGLTAQRVFGSSNIVGPPQVFMVCPLSCPFDTLRLHAGRFGPVKGFALAPDRPASYLVSYVNEKSAILSVCTKYTIKGHGAVIFTTGSSQEDIALHQSLAENVRCSLATCLKEAQTLAPVLNPAALGALRGE